MRKTIAALLKNNGEYTTSHEEVAFELLNCYNNLLGIAPEVRLVNMNILEVGPKVFQFDCEVLLSPIDVESITKAMFDIRDDKYPSRYGFIGAFFKRN